MPRLSLGDALQALVMNLRSTDALDERYAHQIAANQAGHAALCATLAQIAHLAGLPYAAVIAVVVWAGAWEAGQYAFGRHLGRRVRRRWDWATDAACYGAGALVWALSGGIWSFLAGLWVLAAAIVVAVMYWASVEDW